MKCRGNRRRHRDILSPVHAVPRRRNGALNGSSAAAVPRVHVPPSLPSVPSKQGIDSLTRLPCSEDELSEACNRCTVIMAPLSAGSV